MEVTFHEPSHSYFYGCKLIPSVSSLVSNALGNAYENVPEYILEQAAQHGTAVHEAIENHLNGIGQEYPMMVQWSLDAFIKLKNDLGIQTLEIEKMVHYRGRYAGRYDLLCKIDGQVTLVDFKTTAELMKEYVEWQLSYYKLAEEIEVDEIAVIWLPKGKEAKFIYLDEILEERLLANLEEVEDEKERTLQSVPF